MTNMRCDFASWNLSIFEDYITSMVYLNESCPSASHAKIVSDCVTCLNLFQACVANGGDQGRPEPRGARE